MAKGRLIWPFVAIMVLHWVAILLFTRGFLLTRTELPFHSSCSDASQSPCFNDDHDASIKGYAGFNSTDEQRCWTKPLVQKIVIVIIDALRFDFVAPSSCFKEKAPWMDRLQVLQRLASTQPSRARIFKSIADPPTTTLQRLKGLTTGGLPTFIDVGHSFGAPAIVEDNFLNQLVRNGRKVVMMGDDTWMQLFPLHFDKAFPFPSFNVKDLHSVDNGCIDHLMPSLNQEDWDVLIAHFLGVDHAGHIYGVDSEPMIKKLDQYNAVLEEVIGILETHSGPGGLHENTLFLVMGDHGQTLNGDHGGGTAEEVESSVFAMTFDKPPSSTPLEIDPSSSDYFLDETICKSSIQQLDFAVTMSAMLGIPFPFGSIGSVDLELYALVAGFGGMKSSRFENFVDQSNLAEWMKSYVDVLCMNSWQVKKYIDVYSTASAYGFSAEDLMHITDKYTQASGTWSHSFKKSFSSENQSYNTLLPILERQIDAYSSFLASVAELARSKWTEFNMKMMGAGLGVMLFSLFVHFLLMTNIGSNCMSSPFGASKLSFGSAFACSAVLIRACSFLSNSYILEEGKAANFLLATTTIVQLRYSAKKTVMLREAIMLLLLTLILRFSIELGLSKQADTSLFMNYYPSWLTSLASGHPLWTHLSEYLPVLSLLALALIICKSSFGIGKWGIQYIIIWLTFLSYMLIVVHLMLENNLLSLPSTIQFVRKGVIPQTIYAMGLGKLLLLAVDHISYQGKALDFKTSLQCKTVMMFCAWSPTIILLSGNQGSLFAIALIIGGISIMRMEISYKDSTNVSDGFLSLLPVTQWNLLAVCLFFATGHWCAFDGLRYGAAFVGFDEFILVRQAALLAIETFGFSHFLPILGLPFLAARGYTTPSSQRRQLSLYNKLSQVYLIYGVITALTVTLTMICVSIHRRHLMVWGLFAPKFVFDVVGLLLTDALICLAAVYYIGSGDDKL